MAESAGDQPHHPRTWGQDAGTGGGYRHNLLVRILEKLYRLPAGVLIAMVKAYQAVISPHMAPTCRFTPSCSHYAVEALARYGFFKGIVLSTHRILRCHPWGGQGYDPPRWYSEPTEGTGLTETPHGK